MTPDQRLDRAERMLILFVKAGRRARKASREQDQKINILVQAQMETTEQIKGLAAGHAKAESEMAELRNSQKLTDEALRAFIDSLRKGGNGNSPN